MMKPEFAAFIHKLFVHYGMNDPKAERMDSTFEMVKHMSVNGEALEAMSARIRSMHDDPPRNLSKAILEAYEAVRPRAGQQADPDKPAPYVPPTPEQAAHRQNMCRQIREALASGVRPPFAGEPRSTCCGVQNSTDSYHRGGRR